MNSHVELSMFVDGRRSAKQVNPSFFNNTLFMKTKSYCLWALLGVCAALTAFTFSGKEPVRHLVVFKYKATASPEQIMEATRAFRDLKEKIPGIISFEHGDNISTEKKDLGFNHVYLFTFESASARDAYVPHPDHKKFGELLGKIAVVEDVFVVDFVSQ